MKSYYGSFCGKELFLDEETLIMTPYTDEEVIADSELSIIRKTRPYDDEVGYALGHGTQLFTSEAVVIGYDSNSSLNIWVNDSMYKINITEVEPDVVRLLCSGEALVKNLSVHTPRYHIVPFIYDDMLYLCVDDTYIRFGNCEVSLVCPYEGNTLATVKCGNSATRDDVLTALSE